MPAGIARLLLCLAIAAQAAEAPPPATEKPWIFAHRGASGERPEHTLGAYRLALEQGADFIEPDLRMTKDGVFIALHDGSLNRTTDVAAHPEFADRAKVDKKGEKYWVPGDFTLAEIRSLRCRQGTAGRPKDFDGKEGIPTLEEVVELVRTWNRDHKTRVGLVPELRGGAEAFVEFVRKQHLEDAEAPPIYLQSFEAGTLKKVRKELKFPAALLLSEAPKKEQLAELKKDFDAVAVGKASCLSPEAAAWIAEAHAQGLQVIAWTFDDAKYDKKRFRSSREEMECAFRNGVDALFSDFPASGVEAKKAFLETEKAGR
ncbi:MAG: hypothetical protein RL095_2084 [Verrucomicrobiota bacterium]|jgi:glycerophosphoryl diester phosphodiesterase